MQKSHTSRVLSWLLLLLWPLATPLILLILIVLRPDLVFTAEPDLAFYTELIIVVASHIFAFSVIPLIVMWLVNLSEKQFFALKIVGVIVIFVQLALRAMSRLSFGEPIDKTVDIMPAHLNDTVTVVTALALVGTFVGILYVIKKKYLTRSS